MLEVFAGAVVAFAALILVLEPLFRAAEAADNAQADDELVDVEESDSPKVRALLALKEIEFDRATGKLSDDDYAALKARYSAQALAAVKAEAEAGAPPSPPPAATVPTAPAPVGDDAAEAAVRRIRSREKRACPACGPRPEAGAVFCSACGRKLTVPNAPPRCWICGDPLPDGAKYCPGCGKGIAA